MMIIWWYMTAWWFGTFGIYFHLLGMSSSQLLLTPSFFRGVGLNHQPAIKSAIKSAIKLAKARHFGIANSALHLNWPLSFRASGQHWSAPTSNVAATADFFSRVSWPRFKIDDVDNVTVVAVAATGSFGTQKKTINTDHPAHPSPKSQRCVFVVHLSWLRYAVRVLK